jgi:hypothetical protein
MGTIIPIIALPPSMHEMAKKHSKFGQILGILMHGEGGAMLGISPREEIIGITHFHG